MDKNDKKLLKQELISIEKQNIEELILITKDCFELYLYSLIRYKSLNSYNKIIYNIWKEFYYNIKKEKTILNFLLKKYEKLNLSDVYLFLDELDILNEKTYLYYDNILLLTEEAIDLDKSYHIEKQKEFETLIENNKYELEALGLTINFDDIKDFLNFKEDFWVYIKNKIRIIDLKQDMHMEPEVVYMLDKNILTDMRVMIPEVKDLKTVLINIHELTHAYDLYLLLGKEICNSDLYYENKAKLKEKEFQNKLIKWYN